MHKLYESLHQFGEKELRMFLYHLLNTVDHYDKEGSLEEKRLSEELMKIIQRQIDVVQSHQLQSSALQNYVHLVFSLSDAGSLKVALSRIGKRTVSQVMAFNELFSVGPISDLDTITGQQNRLFWMMERNRDYRYGQDINREHQLVNIISAVKSIPENKTIVIWCADNAHDQTGLRFVLYLLREREQQINVVNMSEVYEASGLQVKDKAIPYAMGQIDQEIYEELVRKYYDGFTLEPCQRRLYESEWLQLTNQNSELRIWKDGVVKGSDMCMLDEVIVKAVTELEQEQEQNENGFIRAGSIVARVFDIFQQLVGDWFITYRIWILVNRGILTFRGLPWALHQFSVKLVKG
ncbi:DUF1835 domain-containing protein [Paenibacillus sp. 5J-6]|uniref:DUF1835 domain-containing protein n=1 Tax=Paenibacillus silvestris TaxID=2606219 RepID=A0A6L8V834_9BACL|nr:DUF1835 domain-containing protein [Paenibacillus silvestris]MZQ85499.1 DUF1835 domain-containing protein [Paenibacillus silvestris]